jgi:hypothetical protein
MRPWPKRPSLQVGEHEVGHVGGRGELRRQRLAEGAAAHLSLDIGGIAIEHLEHIGKAPTSVSPA